MGIENWDGDKNKSVWELEYLVSVGGNEITNSIPADF